MSTSIKSHFEVAILGSSLSALILGYRLQCTGVSFVMVSPDSEWGGDYKGQPTDFGTNSQAFDFLPSSDLVLSTLEFISQILDRTLTTSTYSAAPVTYENGHFRDFLGFGDQPPTAMDATLPYVASGNFLRLNQSLGLLVHELFEDISANNKLFDHATKVHFNNELKTFTVALNGAKQITADHVFYAEPPPVLNTMIDTEIVTPKITARINRRGFSTALRLLVIHNLISAEPLSTEKGVHLLMGAKKELCIGLFNQASPLTQLSRWISFIPDDLNQDHEYVGQTLKEMKRQITRAYPGALNEVAFERLVISPGSVGAIGDLVDHQVQLKKNPAFWLAHGLFSEFDGLFGELVQAQKVLTEWSQFKSIIQPQSVATL